MRIASRAVTLAAICGVSLPAPALAADHLVIARAIGTTSKRPVVEFVARHAKPIPVTEAERPTLKDKSLQETAEELCGALSEGYLDEFNVANPGLNAAAETKLGAAAYSAIWPACLATRENVTVTLRKGDTLSGIRLQATGEFAVDALFDDYFAPSGLTKASTLTVGRVLHLPFETLPTRLSVSDAELPKFATDLRAAGGRGVEVDDRPVAKGAIIGAYEPPAGTISGSADDCDGDEDAPWPFNATQVADAYARIDRSQESVVVAIVDNGFFGVPCSDAGCPPSGSGDEGYSERFPRGVFADADTYADHPTAYGPSIPLTPLNYGGDVPLQVNAVSGHGTHVAGLVLGGPAFKDFRDKITEAGRSRIAISILAVARGTESLDPNAEKGFGSALASLRSADVVNMSIAFNEDIDTEAQATLSKVFANNPATLFVAAAGNATDGNPPVDLNDGVYYPAALGGLGSANVLTVASIDSDGRLSKFSNYGSERVDIAAPGCRILSWLRAEGEPVALSGTSQAAPLVTFAAALLRSKWKNVPPQIIKNRLIVSGDIIADDASRARIASGVSLDIRKALFFPWDYIAFDRGGETVEWLGTLDRLSSFGCAGRPEEKFENFKAIKRVAGRTFLFTGKPGGSVRPCEGHLDSMIADVANAIQFRPLFEKVGAGFRKYVPADGARPGDVVPVNAAGLKELIKKSSG